MNVINMACVNPNSPEFQATLEEVGNPLLAEIEIDDRGVDYAIKATNALQSPKAIQLFSTLEKNKVKGDAFWNKIQSDLQIPKEQIELLKQYNTTDREELITNMLADYSYAIEINLAINKSSLNTQDDEDIVLEMMETGQRRGFTDRKKGTPTQYYSNLTVPGGTNYTENEIATPAITPSIKGHAQFATDKGIGWFRSDDKLDNASVELGSEIVDEYDEMGRNIGRPPLSQSFKQEGGAPTKTRRILEVQSDLFQKGRDRSDLISKEEILDSYERGFKRGDRDYFFDTFTKEYWYVENGKAVFISEKDYEKARSIKIDSKENQFLQLLNKDNNWVTFFVKSIIQDSAKKGYEKVLFPSGDTASKVEGHETIEQFKKQKEDRIEYLKNKKFTINTFPFLQKEAENLEEISAFGLLGEQEEIVKAGKSIENYNKYKKIKEAEFEINKEREINQLKQELERIEKEGFGALRPIYNFYENTVANVLKKQGYNPKKVTDEYGNTWNEVEIVSERERQPILLQLTEMPASKASPATIKMLKEAAKQMGINIEDLATYAKKSGLEINSVNGVADLVKGTIAVAIGREDVALGEELVHIASAIVEQVNPDLMTQMIKEIGKYKIYKQTFDEYKDNKYYQLPDGKPNIRKIKKEAIDKLIYEKIVLQAEGNTEFPTLLEKEERNLAQRLWDAILSFVKSLYKKTNIDPFAEVGKMVIEGRVGGTTADIVGADIFLQLDNDMVNKIYDKVVDIDGRLILNPQTAEDKRHYTFDGKRVTLSVTEKIKGKNTNERSEFDKRQDDYKQEWGLAGHGFIENVLINDMIDKDGYAKAEFTETPIDTELNPTIQKGIRSYLEELVRSYDPGTRFLIERKAVNDKVKGMIASTIDLIAIEPITKEDGTKDIKVDVYDWKFTNFDKTTNEDIPFYKQDEWKAQMGEYTKMLYNYGVQPNQLRRARMIPFIANYEYAIKNDPDSRLMLKSLEIGKFDNLKETKLYLLPVALNTESTNKKKVDDLLASLRQQWSKLFKQRATPEEEFQRKVQLDQLAKAIRFLHMKIDFSPLYNVAATFMEKAKKAFEDFNTIDYSNMTQEDIGRKLGELLEFRASAEKFTNLEDIYLSVVPKDKMNEEEKKLYEKIIKVKVAAENMLDEITRLQREFVVQYALKQGLTKEATKDNVLKAEKEIDFIAKTFLEGSKLSPKIIKLATNAILKSSSLVALKTNELVAEYTPLVLDLEKEAAAKGKSAFDMIGRVEYENLYSVRSSGKVFKVYNEQTESYLPEEFKTEEDAKRWVNSKGNPKYAVDLALIKKIDKKFWNEISKAKEAKNKQFFLDNMNKEEYDRLAKEAIDRGVKELEATKFASDPERDSDIREYRIKKLKDSLDINRQSFNGYKGKYFAYIFSQAMKEEDHYSEDYKELVKNPAAFKMWQFYYNLNQMAREMGYIDRKGLSFFPLVEATIIDKFAQTKDVTSEAKDLFKDYYTVRDYEGVALSKVDPETGKLKKRIPRYYTRTSRGVEQLSRDLTKVGTLWIKSLMEYKARTEMENTLLTLHSVEKAKGHIIVDENNNIVYDPSGDPRVDEKTNKNADALEKIVDDYLYGLGENLDSIGNIAIGKATEAIPGGDKERKEQRKVSAKKTIQNLDALTRSLAVGLKFAVAIPNYFGVNFHAFINSKGFYTFSEFQKRNAMVSSGIGLSTIDKALIDVTIPLAEDVALEEQRKLAKKQGYLKYLSSWSLLDVAMVTNSWPERKLQFANALSFFDNSMVEDGKIVNIRQYLRAKDRETKYQMSVSERRALEKTFEDRVKELQETRSIPKIAKIENERLVIPGVSQEELAAYRVSIIDHGRKLNAQMDRDNKAGYRRDSILKSFMMFRTWIPKMISERTLDIQKNEELNEWEYGRVRLFMKVVMRTGLSSVSKIRHIIAGDEEGLRIMNEILEEKRIAYKEKTGQDLEITDEEFYDLMRQELSREMRELGLLVGVIGVFLAAKAAIPPEDEDPITANKYKFFLKVAAKVKDELSFYYNPLSFESITKGSIVPSLGVTVKTMKFLGDLEKETRGQITGDEDLMDKAHPAKRFFDLIPGPSQFQQEILPIIDPELAKEMGIRVTAEARRQ